MWIMARFGYCADVDEFSDLIMLQNSYKIIDWVSGVTDSKYVDRFILGRENHVLQRVDVSE